MLLNKSSNAFSDEKDKNNRYKGTGYILKHMWQVSHRRIGS